MRDEILAEFVKEKAGLILKVYCYVSGGFVLGTAKWRYNIFHHELPLVLEAIRYGDRTLLNQNPHLDSTPVLIHFISSDRRFNKVENWGSVFDYR